MKKFLLLVLCIISCISFSSCSKVNIQQNSTGTIYFIYGEHNIEVQVKSEDFEVIRGIFNNKTLYSDNPSCGFTEKISIVIENRTFCFANDTCGLIFLKEEGKYFSLSSKENDSLKQILASYGLYFPCI